MKGSRITFSAAKIQHRPDDFWLVTGRPSLSTCRCIGKCQGRSTVTLGGHILKHFCTSPLLSQNALFKLTWVFKGGFTVLEADWQHFYIINWRNTLENTAKHLCDLWKFTVKAFYLFLCKMAKGNIKIKTEKKASLIAGVRVGQKKGMNILKSPLFCNFFT